MTAEIQQLHERLDRIEKATLISAKPVLGIEETALFTGFSVRGIYEMTSKKRIPHYKQGGRVFFKKEELVAWMTERRIKTDSQIDSDADTYTAIHKTKH